MSAKPNNQPVNNSGSFEKGFIKECYAMTRYAIRSGKVLDEQKMAPLAEALKLPPTEWDWTDLLPSYNYLIQIIKPARPNTLIIFDDLQKSKSPLRLLGPLPIVQNFMLLAILSIIGMIGFSLFNEVNGEKMQLSMLEDSGLDQLLRILFLVSSAGVGASFSVLFKMNKYISNGTFNIRYNTSYTTQYVLGIVSGLLLSEVFVSLIEKDITEQQSALSGIQVLLKPIMAILGGYSASLVHQVLNKLVSTLEMLFQISKENKKDKQINDFEEQQKALFEEIYTLKNNLDENTSAKEIKEEIESLLKILTNKLK